MIFVLGSDGFLGSSLIREIKKNKLNFLGINRLNYNKIKNKKCDVLINASTNSKKFLSEKDYGYDFRETVVNVQNSINDFQFKKYVLISSSDVYPYTNIKKNTNESSSIDIKKLSNYSLNKYLAEILVKKLTSSWLVLRCGGLLGKGLKKNPIFDLMNRKKIYVHPKSKFQFISTDNVSKITLQLLKRKYNNETFNLSGKGTISIQKIINDYNYKPKFNKTLKKVNYNIDNNKINSFFEIEKSSECVKNFFINQKLTSNN